MEINQFPMKNLMSGSGCYGSVSDTLSRFPVSKEQLQRFHLISIRFDVCFTVFCVSNDCAAYSEGSPTFLGRLLRFFRSLCLL